MKQIKALLARGGNEPRAGEVGSPEASAACEEPAAAGAAGAPAAEASAAPGTSG